MCIGCRGTCAGAHLFAVRSTCPRVNYKQVPTPLPSPSEKHDCILTSKRIEKSNNSKPTSKSHKIEKAKQNKTKQHFQQTNLSHLRKQRNYLPSNTMSRFSILSLIVTSAILFANVSVTLAQNNVNIDWRITTYADQTVKVGDTVTFSWAGTHNVFINDDQDCNKASPNANLLGNVSPVTYTFTQQDLQTNGGQVYFACHVGGHCNAGQNILFNVQPNQQQVVQTQPPAVVVDNGNNNNGGGNNNGGNGYGWGDNNNNNDPWAENNNVGNQQDNNNNVVATAPPLINQADQQQNNNNQQQDIFNNKARGGALIMAIIFCCFIPVILVNVYVIFFRNRNTTKNVDASSSQPRDVLPHYNTQPPSKNSKAAARPYRPDPEANNDRRRRHSSGL